jgi:ferric-dicitrate binding protein FerR (iron transport regulator)
MNDMTPPPATAARGGISEAEKARRRAAIAYARGSVRLEGFSLAPDIEDLNQRYIDGEISGAEHSAAIRSLAGV